MTIFCRLPASALERHGDRERPRRRRPLCQARRRGGNRELGNRARDRHEQQHDGRCDQERDDCVSRVCCAPERRSATRGPHLQPVVQGCPRLHNLSGGDQSSAGTRAATACPNTPVRRCRTGDHAHEDCRDRRGLGDRPDRRRGRRQLGHPRAGRPEREERARAPLHGWTSLEDISPRASPADGDPDRRLVFTGRLAGRSPDDLRQARSPARARVHPHVQLDFQAWQ